MRTPNGGRTPLTRWTRQRPSRRLSAVTRRTVAASCNHAGAILDHEEKKETKADVEDVLPPGSSGIVALFEERWVEDVEKALAKADKTTAHEVDSDSADEVKATATS